MEDILWWSCLKSKESWKHPLYYDSSYMVTGILLIYQSFFLTIGSNNTDQLIETKQFYSTWNSFKNFFLEQNIHKYIQLAEHFFSRGIFPSLLSATFTNSAGRTIYSRVENSQTHLTSRTFCLKHNIHISDSWICKIWVRLGSSKSVKSVTVH
jgi:hypothetical protein